MNAHPPELSSLVPWLTEGAASGSADAVVCQQLVEVHQGHREAVDTLAAAVAQISSPLLLSTAVEVLAWYDRRHAIGELLEQQLSRATELSVEMRLVLAWAQLECGSCDAGTASVMQQTAESSRPWTSLSELLAVELEFQDTGGRHEQLETLTRLEACLAEEDCADPALATLVLRLRYQALGLAARVALARGDLQQADAALVRADALGPDSWECAYLQGLRCWAAGKLEPALALMDRSLELNPHQRRVSLEREVLLHLAGEKPTPSLAALRGPDDVISALAGVLCERGRRAEAYELLAWLDQEPRGPYSTRLVWPSVRRARLERGQRLGAHLAEEHGDFAGAVRWVDRLLEAQGAADRGGRDTLATRAYRLYLLSRHQEAALDSRQPEEDTAAAGRQFNKELGKLSIRHLMREAMFYRGLAAEVSDPERAGADLCAVLRQSSWIKKLLEASPEALLVLGDRLVRAGHFEDAARAYEMVPAATPGAAERMYLARFLCKSGPDLADALDELEHRDAPAPLSPLQRVLHGLCLFQREPARPTSWLPLFAASEDSDLPADLAAVCAVFQELAAPVDPGATTADDARTRLAELLSAPGLSLTLAEGLRSVVSPDGLATLQRLRRSFGATWQEHTPALPEDLVVLELLELAGRGDHAAALKQLDEAEALGVELSARWRVLVLASMAADAARQGDQDQAALHFRLAREAMPTDSDNRGQ